MTEPDLVRGVSVVHDAEPDERQPGVVMLDRARGFLHNGREPAGGYDGGSSAELVLHAFDDRVDLSREPEDDARLDRLDGRLADDRLRRGVFDLAELGAGLDQRIRRDVDA